MKRVVTNDDGSVVSFINNTAERNGKRLDVDSCIVFDLKDGREYFYDLYAWDEFW